MDLTPGNDRDPARDSARPPDGGSALCPGGWSEWGPPELLLDEQGAHLQGWAPSLAADGLELYSARSYGGSMDLWVSRRDSVGVPFRAAAPLLELSAPSEERSPAISAGGLLLFFRSDRAGGQGQDLWQAARADRSSPFLAPILLSGVNSSGADSSPWSSDGLTMYFRSDRAGGQGKNDLYQATRSDLAATFGPVVSFVEINSAAQEQGPALSADGLELYFDSDRSGGQGQADLWRASRPDRASSFGTPVNLTALNTADDDTDAELAPDSRWIIFNRGSSSELWIARRTCP